MAYILTPRFAPAYQAPQCSPFGFCGPSSRPTYGYRTVQRPQPQPERSPFASFFSQLDELVGEIDQDVFDFFFTEGNICFLSPGGLHISKVSTHAGILTYGSRALCPSLLPSVKVGVEARDGKYP